jgi:hypothetical protein
MIKKLKNGRNAVIFNDENGAKVILIFNGLSISCITIPANEFEEDSDDYINKKIDDYLLIKEHDK